ncbi:MAG TPA: hypothetical protein VEO56_13720, partial [Bacteroidota bacterium]|nr:hypothetical protein [Bacteroidota bacterium]
FPHRGVSLVGNLDADLEGIEGSGGFDRWFAKADVRLPVLEAVSLTGGGFIGLAHGTSLPAHYFFFLGGMNSALTIQDQQLTRGSFAGLNARELVGTQAQNVYGGIQWEPVQRAIVQLQIETSLVSNESALTFDGEHYLWGGAVEVGYDSLIGPLELVLSTGKLHHALVYLNVGYVF